jgi:hypothetical protein
LLGRYEPWLIAPHVRGVHKCFEVRYVIGVRVTHENGVNVGIGHE